ncbi:MAG: dTDP-4-dehydrorhamnose reductase [Deltaproteobacteria bacterium]|nr:dTDP-4-dehydrorhamnose reductase [Deltaproteobacteria bacterium]
MKILLFGGGGQLGSEIIKRGYDLNFEVISPVTSELDIADRFQVMYLANQVKPDLVINAAAYTAVDQAEEEIQRAYATNRDGAHNIALAAEQCQARLIQISTDYVFDDTHSEPIKEDAKPSPLSVYGASKYAGERAVQAILGDAALVVRTSSLHGKRGQNFVHTMIRLLSERDLVQVVNDQIMSPTWAGWLAEVLLDLGRIPAQGVLHACGAGAVSWYDFACEIRQLVAEQLKTRRVAKIEPIPARDYKSPARRPIYSVMDTGRLTGLLGREPISWRDGLKAHLTELGYKL